ncbi:hypothetical protein BOTCAL_1327g00010 [Botryotinia calthae]|uniref:Peptidase C14 caspase domain-containing protein n=1 Tax=Botryotinia calthae TaxID=38488 RepID=A0A4Y8CE71_9HELO|nr:hypothetical protein BOTCAL_1327g00010 [Botryotinia calthae]
MTSLSVSRRFAVLVGVDFYQDNKGREYENGNSVSLSHLQGATNDVKQIQILLENQFGFTEPVVLTSSRSELDPSIPSEPEDEWPTHSNIKKAFDNIYDKASSGDVFFFHFSGHGAPLRTISSSPSDGRPNDPSLMTADYCCRNPAIRGWELNQWLQRFNEKSVRVVVLLDSCYSGGAWRTDNLFRSPENWTPPPNLPADEAAIQGSQRKPGHRDVDLSISWDINPKEFTLITACQSSEKVAEIFHSGSSYGVFIFVFKTYLENISNLPTSYRAILDYAIVELVFLKDYEPSLALPIIEKLQGDILEFFVGKVYAIKERTEFITASTTSSVIVSVFEVNDFESKARVIRGFIQGQPQTIELLPWRWSSEKPLNIIVDRILGFTFQEKLFSEIEKRISGNIRYLFNPELDYSKKYNSQANWFELRAKENGEISIFGPEKLLGHKGPVRGWNAKGENYERARESAVALAHLLRFGQILDLQNESQDTKPFRANIKSQGDKKLRYEFQNEEDEELYVAVVILGPGYNIKQLFPTTDTFHVVPPNRKKCFPFKLEVPPMLILNGETSQNYKHRDIIRTVVTRGKRLSLKSMELPHIWSAEQGDYKRPTDQSRDGNLVDDFGWWIQDEQMFSQ